MSKGKPESIQTGEKNSSPAKSLSITALPGKLMLWTGLIAAMAFVAFSPALSNGFVDWDDMKYIPDNPLIRDLGIQNILHLFHYKTYVIGNYHPLTMLSYALEYKIAGVNPLLYHLDNILIHLLNIFLIAAVTWMLTKEFYTSQICAALFALHPMRVESVVWAAERKDVLYTFFFLLSWLFYLKYILNEKRKTRQFAFSLLFFTLSILCKAQAVVLPLVFVLTDYWFHEKREWKRLKGLIPFFAISLLFGLLALKSQSVSLTEARFNAIPFGMRILVACYNVIAYIYKFLLPWSLCCFYGYLPEGEMWKLYLAPAVVIILAALFIWKFRKNKTWVFGMLFFLFTISIVSQILPVADTIISDRYTYIPYIGFFFISARLVCSLIRKHAKWQTAVIILTSALILSFGIKSYIQAKTWKNTETMWLQVLRCNDKEPTAYLNLGSYYYNTKYDEKEYRERAFEYNKKCIANKVAFTNVQKAYSNLGAYYINLKQYDLALENFNEALRIEPKYLEGRFLRAYLYTNMKEYNKAISDYQNCVMNNPDYEGSYANLGNIYFKKGEYDLALSYYTQALQLNPRLGMTWLNRSKTYYQKKDFGNAVIDAKQAALNGAPADFPICKDVKSAALE